ncbi:MAG: hypothetical protein GEV06_14300 [Luteitalea sp.]|nr:hypothetical protein [Luteitalea sp.]
MRAGTNFTYPPTFGVDGPAEIGLTNVPNDPAIMGGLPKMNIQGFDAIGRHTSTPQFQTPRSWNPRATFSWTNTRRLLERRRTASSTSIPRQERRSSPATAATERFTGTWKDFINVSRVIDPRQLLQKRRMALVSRWNSATINQHFLPYNFRPKTEWPSLTGSRHSDGQRRQPRY